MHFIRAFITGAVIGLVFGVGEMFFYPLYEGQFPWTADGMVAAFRAIHWFGVWFLTGLFAVGWTLHELRAVQAANEAGREIDFWRDLWYLLTFWRR